MTTSENTSAAEPSRPTVQTYSCLRCSTKTENRDPLLCLSYCDECMRQKKEIPNDK